MFRLKEAIRLHKPLIFLQMLFLKTLIKEISFAFLEPIQMGALRVQSVFSAMTMTWNLFGSSSANQAEILGLLLQV